MPLDPYDLASPGVWYESGGVYTNASTIQLIDSFEDGNITEWSNMYGPTGEFSAVQSTAYDGSYSLQADAASSGIYTMPGDGLPNLPFGPGETLRVWIRSTLGYSTGTKSKISVSYGIQDVSNSYYIRYDWDAGQLRIYLYEADSGTQLAEDPNPTLAADTYYLLELDWSSGNTHTASLYDAPPESGGSTLASCAATDSTFGSGGISAEADYASGTAFFDYYHKL